MIVSIPARFCGPVNSGNGGYTAGLIAESIGRFAAAKDRDKAWSIKLREPPPLEQPLEVGAGDNGVFYLRRSAAGPQNVIAEASWQSFPLTDLLTPVALDEACVAASRGTGSTSRAFSSCFVCGTVRQAGDGLRLFPGPVDDVPDTADGRLVATIWQPDDSLAENGRIAARYLWSALDCPGYFATNECGEMLLLAQISAQVYVLPEPNKPLLIQAWPLGRERRSKMAATAIYAEDGRLLAASHTRWLPPRAASAPPPGAN